MGNLTKGKHVVQEINGIRCTVVESGISAARAAFLKDILEFNKLQVEIAETKNAEGNPEFTLGVTNIVFNPVIAMYARKLCLPDGRIVTPAFWNQDTDYIDPRYWRFRVKQNA